MFNSTRRKAVLQVEKLKMRFSPRERIAIRGDSIRLHLTGTQRGQILPEGSQSGRCRKG